MPSFREAAGPGGLLRALVRGAIPAGAALLLAGPPASPQPEAALLLPGAASERSIAPGESHRYRLAVADVPLLVTVEQRSIDLLLEVQGPAGSKVVSNASDSRWSSEVLLLQGAGERRIEVRPAGSAGWPGGYAIRVEALAAEAGAAAEGKAGARRAAFAWLSRAGEEAFPATPEARTRAIASNRAAASAWSALGDRRWEAEALDRLGTLEADADQPRLAAEDLERAATLWRDLGEPEREAAVRNALGLRRRATGEHAAARAALEGALALWQRLGRQLDGAETASNLCLLEQTVGSPSVALACYQEPLAAFREAHDRSDEARILNNLGGTYDLLGNPDAALEHYRQALALRHTLGEAGDEAQTLNNLAVLHRSLGEWQEALRLFGEEREILQRTGGRADLQVSLLNNLGSTYLSLGEPLRALSFLEDAMKLRRQLDDRRGEVVTLNNLGLVRLRLGGIGAALELHRQARKLAAALADGRQEAVSRLRLAAAEIEGGDPAAALRELAPALTTLRTAGLRQAELQALQLQGQALLRAGQPDAALPVLREVLAGRRTLRDRAGEADALGALAAAERSMGQAETARGHAEEAVARVEELRGGFASPDLRAAFLATRRRAYSLLIDLLMDRHQAEPGAGWDRVALGVSERARARSLLDALSSADAGQGEGGVPAPLLERWRALRRRLSTQAERQLRQQSGAKAEALGREIETLLAERDSVEAEMQRADPRYAAFSQPPPIGPEEIAGLLEGGTLLLEFSLGEERSFLWLVGEGELRTVVLPREREIEALARQVYADLSTVEAGGRRSEAAAKLGRLLFGPIWSRAARARRWVIVPDGALHSVPFAALTAPDAAGGPLLERVEIDDLPSATTLAQLRKRPQPPASARRAAILADPVFSADDPRLIPRDRRVRLARTAGQSPFRGAGPSALAPTFVRLPASRREAEDIAALAPPGEVWIARDFAATREVVLSGALRGFRVLHFATHAVADTRTPERLSGLVFSQVDESGRPREGFLGLSEIYDLRLDAGLVVLSGCRTALGKEVRGEGVMGLTRGFLYAGVPRVVASLWPVQDRAASELMTRFYRALWQEGLTPAAALRQAQRSLRRNPRMPLYRDPFYWAGYVLQGDWR